MADCLFVENGVHGLPHCHCAVLMLDIRFQLHPDSFQIYEEIMGEMRRRRC